MRMNCCMQRERKRKTCRFFEAGQLAPCLACSTAKIRLFIRQKIVVHFWVCNLFIASWYSRNTVCLKGFLSFPCCVSSREEESPVRPPPPVTCSRTMTTPPSSSSAKTNKSTCIRQRRVEREGACGSKSRVRTLTKLRADNSSGRRSSFGDIVLFVSKVLGKHAINFAPVREQEEHTDENHHLLLRPESCGWLRVFGRRESVEFNVVIDGLAPARRDGERMSKVTPLCQRQKSWSEEGQG